MQYPVVDVLPASVSRHEVDGSGRHSSPILEKSFGQVNSQGLLRVLLGVRHSMHWASSVVLPRWDV